MKIAIISDVHDNITNLRKTLAYCRKNEIKIIICCGDLTSRETLDFLCNGFSGEILYTLGNMDNQELRNMGQEKKYKNAKIFENFGEAEIDKKKIAFVHFPDKARKLCESGRYDLVFFGHTHKFQKESVENCTMLNPGNVTGSRNLPTFVVWDTASDKLNLLEINQLGK